MNQDHDVVPTWLVVLIALFGVILGSLLITFYLSYAQAKSLRAERDLIKTRLGKLQVQELDIKARIPLLDQALVERAKVLEDLARRDKQDRDAVEGPLDQAIRQSREEVVAGLKKTVETKKDLEGQAERAMGDLAQEERQFTTRQQENEAALRKYRQDIENRSREIERKQKDRRDHLLALDNEILEREKRVKELTDRIDTKTDELRSDGHLLQAHVTDGFVIINRGQNDDLPNGTRFVVFNRKAGQNYIKGEIEVVKVYPGMAECRVTSEKDANDPLVPGDHIHNTIYNPDETKVFVIAGDFELYTIPELTRFVTDAGGQVDADISSRTHYLVAGRKADKALAQASLNGVTIMSERQLLDFVKRPERFALTRGMTVAIAGDFSVVNRGVVEEFVKRHHGVVEGKVGDRTNMLIAGDNASEAVAQARLVGAIIIDQRQLAHLMSAGQP